MCLPKFSSGPTVKSRREDFVFLKSLVGWLQLSRVGSPSGEVSVPSSLVSMAYLESRGEYLMMGKLRQFSKVQGEMPLTQHQAAVVKSECVVGDWCVGVTPGGSLTLLWGDQSGLRGTGMSYPSSQCCPRLLPLPSAPSRVPTSSSGRDWAISFFPFVQPPEVSKHTAVLVHFCKRLVCPVAFETSDHCH